MNWFLICVFLVVIQLWHPCTSQVELNLTKIDAKPLKSTGSLYQKMFSTRFANPWTAIFNHSYYVTTILMDGRLNEYTKAVAHFALNNHLHIHKAQLDMMQQGLQLIQSNPTVRLAKIDIKLFQDLIAIQNNLISNYIQKYAEPMIGPIPDRIKQLPLRADTLDYIQKLNHISLTKKVVSILAACLAPNFLIERELDDIKQSYNYKPNALLPLLTYQMDDTNAQNRYNATVDIMASIDTHYHIGMTPEDQQQAIDTYEDIWSAECRTYYGNAFVEQMGAYSRQLGDSQPFLKQYLH